MLQHNLILLWACFVLLIKKPTQGFPGGSVVKNPSANAGDVGSIPDPWRSHILLSNYAHVA